jgi:hypothetical protein
MNRMQKMVEARGKDAHALFWDDMVNPDHNGGRCDYTPVVGGGRFGCTDGALLNGLIHEKVAFYSWSYGHTNTSSQWDPTGFTDWKKISHAPELFAKSATHPSYPWVASPLGDPTNIIWWARSVKKALSDGGDVLGFIDTSWVSAPQPKKFGNLPAVSQCAWNLDNCLEAAPPPLQQLMSSAQLKNDDGVNAPTQRMPPVPGEWEITMLDDFETFNASRWTKGWSWCNGSGLLPGQPQPRTHVKASDTCYFADAKRACGGRQARPEQSAGAQPRLQLHLWCRELNRVRAWTRLPADVRLLRGTDQGFARRPRQPGHVSCILDAEREEQR